jgi:methylated-DNA-[protein]-cysteine S-methyltransferase
MIRRTFDSPIGAVLVHSEDGVGISKIDLGSLDLDARDDAAVLVEAEKQLRAYFAKELVTFALPLAPEGTAFQKRVWAELMNVKPGTTTSYGALAARLGSVARAVGSANGANPIAIVVPCHRVIGNDGSLTGYAGGLERKRWLLLHEGALLA